MQLSLDENIKVGAVEFSAFDVRSDDVECAAHRQCEFVRSVTCECVEDVANRHHSGLGGNLLGRETVWVTGAVQFFVVFGSNVGDLFESPAPRNHFEDIEGFADVTFDLYTFRSRQTAPGNR